LRQADDFNHPSAVASSSWPAWFPVNRQQPPATLPHRVLEKLRREIHPDADRPQFQNWRDCDWFSARNPVIYGVPLVGNDFFTDQTGILCPECIVIFIFAKGKAFNFSFCI
jgi:hypothetical protein